MNPTDKKLLKQYGWQVECESPFEIRHEDGSFATLNAAEIILSFIKDEDDEDDEDDILKPFGL
jgi:hypothetical protein